MRQTQQHVNMPHFQTGKLTQIITSSCWPGQKLWASLCADKWVWNYWDTTHTLPLSHLLTAGHTTLVWFTATVFGEGSGKSNILLSSSLWQSQQLWEKLHSSEVRSWMREIQWITSRASAICLQGNHCIIILQDKAHTCLHNSMCMSQNSILVLKWEGKYLKISNCTG